MLLKSEVFYGKEKLCEFVNKNHISKEQIQEIIQYGDYFTIFYWA